MSWRTYFEKITELPNKRTDRNKWEETMAAFTTRIRAATGGSGEIVVAFAGVGEDGDPNGTYVASPVDLVRIVLRY